MSLVCDTSLVWCFAHPAVVRSQLSLALEQQERILVAWCSMGEFPLASEFQPDANLGVPGGGQEEFRDASAEQGVVSPSHSLIQMCSPLWARSLLHWETQGRREHVLGLCGVGWHLQGSAAAQTCTGL